MMMSLLPFVIISIPFAIGNYLIDARLGRSRALWLLISFIPVVSTMFTVLVFYVTALSVLDRLAVLSKDFDARRAMSS